MRLTIRPSTKIPCPEQLRDGSLIWVSRVSDSVVPSIHGLIRREIGPDTASLEVMQKMHRFNRDTFWAIYRVGTMAPFELAGCCAFLFPNEEGPARTAE